MNDDGNAEDVQLSRSTWGSNDDNNIDADDDAFYGGTLIDSVRLITIPMKLLWKVVMILFFDVPIVNLSLPYQCCQCQYQCQCKCQY